LFCIFWEEQIKIVPLRNYLLMLEYILEFKYRNSRLQFGSSIFFKIILNCWASRGGLPPLYLYKEKN
jgi:hypothetical protein